MKLQILISHYNERPELVCRLLQSIDDQVDVDHKSDFSVLICSDGDEYRLPEDKLSQYKFAVAYHVYPHRGLWASRNTLLDLATADYVMFCDADDCFSDVHGLSTLLKAVDEHHSDVIGSAYDCEIPVNYKFEYRTLRTDILRVHGKIFRRKYLADNDIRSPEETPSMGDMHFLWLAYRLTSEIVWLPDNFYIWKWNDLSVTRTKPNYNLRTYGEVIWSYALLIDVLEKRQRKDLINDVVTMLMNMMYIDWYSDWWKRSEAEYVENAKKACSHYVRQLYDRYMAVSEEQRRGAFISFLIGRRTYGPPEGFEGMASWMSLASSYTSAEA